MNPILRNVLAVIAGMVVGGIVNMAIVMQGALPDGVTMENLKENIHLLKATHYVFPILGHALGTLAGATVAAIIAGTHKMRMALIIGVIFLAGGIANAMMLSFPMLPAAIDIIIAYIPMGYLGGILGKSWSKTS